MPFITFEGIDQSGKSTQLELLSKAVAESGLSVLATREPGGTKLGDQIRAILLGFDHAGMDPWSEALLYAAARAQLVREVIEPAIAAGTIVLSDRYIDSSLAYQGIARGLGIEKVMEMNMWATRGLMPDITFVLHLDVDISRERLQSRTTGKDRIESEPLEFHHRVEEGYRKLESMYPDRIVGISGRDSVAEVHSQIVAACRDRIGWDIRETDSGQAV